jgi:hypothetical protein
VGEDLLPKRLNQYKTNTSCDGIGPCGYFEHSRKLCPSYHVFLRKAMDVQINHNSSNTFLTIVGTMTLFLKILLSFFDGHAMYASYIVLLSSSLSTRLEEMRKFVKFSSFELELSSLESFRPILAQFSLPITRLRENENPNRNTLKVLGKKKKT